MICGSGGSKCRLAKAAGAEPAGQMSDKKLRSTFPKSKCTKHAKLGALREGAKLRWWKSARRCGAKHISKSKSTKHISFGALLEVEMRKKCTPLWCEAHFEVKMYKTHHFWSTYGSSTFRSQNVQNTPGSEHFWKLRYWKSARRCGAKHISNLKALTTDSLGALLEVSMAQWIRHLATSEKNVQVS